jgi:hypothetical protein
MTEPSDIDAAKGILLQKICSKTVHSPCPIKGLCGSCLIWTGYTCKGYGKLTFRKKTQPVHRWAYELIIGKIPTGKTLDHLCRVRACWNPAHVEPVTLKVNILRGICPPANNARMTHCKKGHELVGRNLMIRAGKRHERQCRTCHNVRQLRYFHAKKS